MRTKLGFRAQARGDDHPFLRNHNVIPAIFILLRFSRIIQVVRVLSTDCHQVGTIVLGLLLLDLRLFDRLLFSRPLRLDQVALARDQAT